MDIRREKLEQAFEQIRKDIAALQKDLGYAELNRSRWIFIIMWLVLANLVKDALDLGALLALGISAVLVILYRLVDGMRITRRALRALKVPLEPTWDTKVDLS